MANKQKNNTTPGISVIDSPVNDLYLVENTNKISCLWEFKRAWVFAPSPQEAFRRVMNALAEDKHGLNFALHPQASCTVKKIPLPNNLVFGIELANKDTFVETVKLLNND